MSIQHLASSAVSPPNSRHGRPARSPVASDEGEQTKSLLREAVARYVILLRQMDELTQKQKVLNKLFPGREDAANRVASLSPRQRQIMGLVLAGHPNKTIAADIGISRRTVENHRASMMKKMGAKSLPALSRLALAAIWNGAPNSNPRLELSQPRREPTSHETTPAVRFGAAASAAKSPEPPGIYDHGHANG